MDGHTRHFLSGNQAVGLACSICGVDLATGYPGTPSTEIVEHAATLGLKCQWAPNEKVAYEVGLGVSFAGGRAIVCMKHLGVNVCADPLFCSAYTGVKGGLVLVSADDPGMFASQTEQDNRRYAVAAGVPLLEPADSQEAFDFTCLAFKISREWKIPVMLRLTTRVCHSNGVVLAPQTVSLPPIPVGFEHHTQEFAIFPASARKMRASMCEKMVQMKAFNEQSGPVCLVGGESGLGIVSCGVAALHAQEVMPDASHLRIGLTHPLPLEKIREFAGSFTRCVVVEEGEHVMADALRAAGIEVEKKPDEFCRGELTPDRIREIFDIPVPESSNTPGKPPVFCNGCVNHFIFQILKKLDCVVAGDIGCYSMGGLPPYRAIDTIVCMGASIGVGLGIRLMEKGEVAQRVISVLGDSTFFHSGLTGIAEMVYNPPESGHVVLVLDNGTTAMTGLQEHPGTGRRLNLEPAAGINIAAVCKAMGVEHVFEIDPLANRDDFEQLLKDCLAGAKLCVVVAKRECLLQVAKIKKSKTRGGSA